MYAKMYALFRSSNVTSPASVQVTYLYPHTHRLAARISNAPVRAGRVRPRNTGQGRVGQVPAGQDRVGQVRVGQVLYQGQGGR